MRAAGEEDVLTAMLINDPATVAELRELYPRYEQALVSNDVETLMSMFWASPYVARFGPPRASTASARLRPFAKDAPQPTWREPSNGSISSPSARTSPASRWPSSGKSRAGSHEGRQSQTWARLPEGWRIVFAHVSLLP
jgi:hypothetical protein